MSQWARHRKRERGRETDRQTDSDTLNHLTAAGGLSSIPAAGQCAGEEVRSASSWRTNRKRQEGRVTWSSTRYVIVFELIYVCPFLLSLIVLAFYSSFKQKRKCFSKGSMQPSFKDTLNRVTSFVFWFSYIEQKTIIKNKPSSNHDNVAELLCHLWKLIYIKKILNGKTIILYNPSSKWIVYS